MYKTQRARSPNVVWKLTLKYESTPVLAEDSTEGRTGSHKSRREIGRTIRDGIEVVKHRGCRQETSTGKSRIAERVWINCLTRSFQKIRFYNSVLPSTEPGRRFIPCSTRRDERIPPLFVLVRVPQPRPSCLDGLFALLIPLPVDFGPPDDGRLSTVRSAGAS